MEIKTQNQPNLSTQTETGNLERWASLIGGGALVLYGLSQKSLRGTLMVLAGGGLAYHGATQPGGIADISAGGQKIAVEKTVTINNKSPEELYQFWRNLENLPHIMLHLKSVKVYDERHSHWIAKAPLGGSVEWDAEIIKDEENKLIAWASADNATIENSGFVRFKPATGGRGTEVKVVMEYQPPAGQLGAAVAKLFGEEPEQQLGDDLRRFKQLMETGEIATVQGQPMGHS